MWTVKTQSARRIEENEVPKDAQGNPQIGRMLQILLELTFTNGTRDISVSTFEDNEESIKRTIKQNLDRLNGQEEAIEKVNKKTLDLSDPEPVEPTAEELKEKEIAEAEQALDEEIAKAKREKEAAEIAVENAEVKAKLNKLKALKG